MLVRRWHWRKKDRAAYMLFCRACLHLMGNFWKQDASKQRNLSAYDEDFRQVCRSVREIFCGVHVDFIPGHLDKHLPLPHSLDSGPESWGLGWGQC